MEKHYNKVSLWSRCINKLLLLTDMKKNSDTIENSKKYIDKLMSNQKKYIIPEKLKMKKSTFEDIDVYCYNGTLDDNNQKIIYVHGGSYIEEATIFQIKFAMEVAKETNSTLIFPVYSLAPYGNYKMMYSVMYKLYKQISCVTRRIILLGDSAGGGFILSFAMYIRDHNLLSPEHIITMSPWIDLSMTNPKIYEDAKDDNMCGVDGTRYAGMLWADGLDLKDPLISPIYGSFKQLGVITIIVGGREILTSECYRLHQLLNDSKIEHNFIEYKDQGHVFGVLPIKERKLLIKDICNIINEGRVLWKHQI